MADLTLAEIVKVGEMWEARLAKTLERDERFVVNQSRSGFYAEHGPALLAVAKAALTATPTPAPSEAVRGAAERLWHSLTPPRSTTDDGMLLVRAEDVEAVLRALSSPAAPAKDEVREAAEATERALGAWIGVHSAQHAGGLVSAVRHLLCVLAARGVE